MTIPPPTQLELLNALMRFAEEVGRNPEAATDAIGGYFSQPISQNQLLTNLLMHSVTNLCARPALLGASVEGMEGILALSVSMVGFGMALGIIVQEGRGKEPVQ